MKLRSPLAALVALALFSACSPAPPGDAEAVAAAPSPSPSPLPLTAHVVPADGLPGFSAKGRPAAMTTAEFAAQHDKTEAELADIGMVAGAGLEFVPEGDAPGLAMSLAQQFASTGEAEREAERLFAANAEPEKGTTVTPIEVPEIPGGMAVQLDGKMGGQQVRGLELVFVEGDVLHEIFAFTLAEAISIEDLVTVATTLHAEVEGSAVAVP